MFKTPQSRNKKSYSTNQSLLLHRTTISPNELHPPKKHYNKHQPSSFEELRTTARQRWRWRPYHSNRRSHTTKDRPLPREAGATPWSSCCSSSWWLRRDDLKQNSIRNYFNRSGKTFFSAHINVLSNEKILAENPTAADAAFAKKRLAAGLRSKEKPTWIISASPTRYGLWRTTRKILLIS